ncbi:hypothetical protein NQ314_011194, partial [Rhamnusium bicolor]
NLLWPAAEMAPHKMENTPSCIVKRLIAPIDKSARNVTMDNWFVSDTLGKDLLEKHKITCVGTIRRNKREIPQEFLTTKRKLCSTLFGFTNNFTLFVLHTEKNCFACFEHSP